MRSNPCATLSAFTLVACVAYTAPAEASVIYVHASGAIGGYNTGVGTTATFIPPSGGAYFGLSPGSFVGAHADFAWTIDIGQLGPSTGANGPNSAQWAFDNPNLAPLDNPFVTSPGVSIGITGQVTVNGITLSAGVDRQVLYLQQDALNSFVLRTDTWRAFTFIRDYVDLDIVNGASFLASLNPLDLVGLTLTASCSAGGTELARLNHFDGATAVPRNTSGAVNLCAQGSTFSVTAPEPSTFALIGAALLSLFGFGLMRRRADP